MTTPTPEEPAIARDRLEILFKAADHQCPIAYLSPFVATNAAEIRELVRGYRAWKEERDRRGGGR